MLDYLPYYLFGYTFNIIQNTFGMYNLDTGVDYYGEIHHSFLNKVIHFCFMPFTYYGFLLSIPALLRYNNTEMKHIVNISLYWYFGLYSRINVSYALIFYILYSIPTNFAITYYYPGYVTVKNGLIISTVSLLIQELIGHYFGGDPSSRLDGVLNAILYAKYFSISHLMIS